MTAKPRLAGRTAIVTGAAQGIGAAYARALAAEGAALSLCDLIDPAQVVEEIVQSGGRAIGSVTDITSAEQLQALVRRTDEAFGGIQVLVNNAALFGTLERKRFTEISSEEWDRVMTVNTRGTFECVKAVVPVMRRQRYGKIINISSGTVFKGQTHLLHYISSKGAVLAMTRALARELGEDGISVNCIAPGLTMSENVHQQMAGEEGATQRTVQTRCFKRDEMPEDVTGTVVFLASGESDFMTGQTIVVDGGSVMH
jgi:NAD(P)-dependent dehydrogenase (short-subunit alcohol dehydrogenase family)